MRLLLLLLLTQPAAAGKRDKATEAAPSGPTVEEVLEAAGWTITPERSSTYAAGDIYDMVSNSKVAVRADCFEASPEEGVYTSLQVVQSMKASANVRLGVVKLSGGGVQYKQRTFAEPYLSELPLLRQQLTEQCAGQLRSLDVSSMHVLTAVLSAEVKEENCTTVEGGAQVVGVASGELGVSQQCKEESAGHVAVAYKTRPVSELLGGGGRVSVPAGGGPAVGAGGGGSGGAFDGVGDLAAQLAAAEALKTKLEGELSACLDGEAAKVASSARSDWAKLGELRTLASSSAEAHAATIPQVERFVSVYGDREVTCRNDLGERSRRVTPSEVDEARAWLEQPASQSGGAVSGDTVGGASIESPLLGTLRWAPKANVYVMEHEVMQSQWMAVMGSNPSHFADCDRCPVEQVSWNDAVAFAAAVSAQEGVTYRLLTSPEWKAAARGGESHKYAGSDDLDAVGWYDGNSGNKTHPVCEKARNAYGLCDMSGNVWEWTSTEQDVVRAYRGGSWSNDPQDARVALRSWFTPVNRNSRLGLRLARTSP